MGGGDVGKAGVLEDAALEEGHDVEGGADDGVVFAEAEGARDGDGGGLHGVDDAVLEERVIGHHLTWSKTGGCTSRST